MTPLCHEYEQATLALCNYYLPCGFDTDDKVTETSTFEALNNYWNETGRICVKVDHSDDTIYSSPRVNWAFRAWHDFCHVKGQFPFSRAGEIETCHMQQAQIARHFGRAWSRDTLEKVLMLLWCEVVEQVIYYEETGNFTPTQRQFCIDRMREYGYRLQ